MLYTIYAQLIVYNNYTFFEIFQMLLEVIVNTPAQGGGGQEGSPSRNREAQRRPLLHFAPSAFNDVVVRLVSQLIVTTKDAPNPRLW